MSTLQDAATCPELFLQLNNGWEMVTLAVQPGRGSLSTQRRALILAVLLNKIVAVEDLMMVVTQSATFFQ